MRAPDESLVGAVLGGQYRIVTLIASGGMGAVYGAVHVRLGHEVAIKILHPLLSEDDEALVRFEREARAAASLGHPNVVLVHDFHRAPGELAWLAMERVHGRSLRELLAADGAMTPERAVRLVLPLLSALEAAHAAGIVHRDLKPGNVVIASPPGLDEVPKLVDFGIAKMSEGQGYTRLTRTGVVLGTPAYMAPEVAAGSGADARSDVYAMGAILYAMLAGRPPFRATSLGELVADVATRTPAPLADAGAAVAPALEAVVMRALAKDPAQRFVSAREMSDAIVVAQRAAPVSAPPPTASHEVAMLRTRASPVHAPTSKPSRPSYAMGAVVGVVVSVVGVGVLVAIGVVAWLTFSAPREQPRAAEPSARTHMTPAPTQARAIPPAGPAVAAPSPVSIVPTQMAARPPSGRWGSLRPHVRMASEIVERLHFARADGLSQISGDCLDRTGTARAGFTCGWTIQFVRDGGRAIVKWEELGPAAEVDSVDLRFRILAPDAVPDSDAIIAEMDAQWTCPFRWERVSVTVNANGQFDTVELHARGSERYAIYKVQRYRNGRLQRSFRCYD